MPGNEPHHCHLEHKLGPAADRKRRTVPENAQARCACASRKPGVRTSSSRTQAFERHGLHPSLRPGHESPITAWRSFPRCRSSPAPISIIAAARRIAGTSRSRSTSAAIRSCSTISTFRPAATFPTPTLNVKFAHKLDFYREMAGWHAERKPEPRALQGLRRITVGDLNVAPLEHDVWSHKQLLKIVSHTPVEVELFGRLQASLDWIDVPRKFVPARQEALLVVELSQQRLARHQPRPPARPYPGQSGPVPGRSRSHHIDVDSARLGETIGPCAGVGDVRGLRARSEGR